MILCGVFLWFGSGYSHQGGHSLVELIANPKRFHNDRVGVSGFLSLEFEGNQLYLHREDYEQGLSRNAVWIEASPEMMERKEEIDLRYVRLLGRFNAKNHGHMGHWVGAIERVEWIQILPSRKEIEALRQSNEVGTASAVRENAPR